MSSTKRVGFALVASILLPVILATPLGLAAADDRNLHPPENIALGKHYKLWPAPNYPYCTDPDDAIQLTDGKTTKDYFWTQKGTVGWSNVPYVTITVDLGKDEPIDGVAFDTAAGVAGVEWPLEIDVLVSGDGKVYHHAGDLVSLDRKHNGFWPKGYAIRRLVTHELQTHGRYVQFLLIVHGPFAFCDEVEVFHGPGSLLAQSAGPPAADAKQIVGARKVELAIRHRYEADVASLRALIRAARLPSDAESRLLGRLDEVGAGLQRTASEPQPTPFRAILPFGRDHARLFALQAELWKAMGCPALSAWVPATWDPVLLFGPPQRPGGRIEVHVMRGEYRAAAVNLANSRPEPVHVAAKMEDLAPGPCVLQKSVRLHEVQWTDTSMGEPVAAALPELSAGSAGPAALVPSGLVRQLWLTFHVDRETPPGEYHGNLVLDTSDRSQSTPIRVPIRLHVYPIDFPQQTTLWLGGWCYTDGKGSGGVTQANRTAFIRHLREHFVNCPWATSGVMMQCSFSPSDPDKVELDTRGMDEWLTQWPDAKRYMVFLSAGSSLGGARFDSPEFPRRVKAWISAWVRHLETKGVSPDRLCLLIEDEPHEGTDVGPLIAWARAIHAAEPKVVIWEDPTYDNPAKAPSALFEGCQILCPNRPMWLTSGEKFARFYLNEQQAGRTLQFYSCSGPARLLDPYSYYRLQAWHCWQIRATGSWFWSFGDNDGSSSWNEYMAVAGPYTPLFLDDNSVVAGKQMEAIRESVEDYEYFVMLRQAITRAKAAGRTGAEIDRAEALLSDGVRQVLVAPGAEKLFWREPKDRNRADTVRLDVLKALRNW
ncbi:MAG: discoidin domain-containing protein [Thermoguttaceae bacterium]